MAGWPSPRRQQETVSDRLASGWEGALVGFAQKLVNQIEGTPTTPQPTSTGPSLEEVLLEGSVPERRRPEEAAVEATAPATELDLLRADFDSLLLQRAKLRAQLVAEQERRARAEAELVSLGACWLGTDTQKELQRRAAAERQRELDAARADLMREAEQRVAKVRAEMALLQQRLGEKAPSALALRMELRGALNAELARERQEARAAVQAQLEEVGQERDSLADALRQVEGRHKLEMEGLRLSLRRAEHLLQEQYDSGFISGLKQAAEALGTARAPEGAAAAAAAAGAAAAAAAGAAAAGEAATDAVGAEAAEEVEAEAGMQEEEPEEGAEAEVQSMRVEAGAHANAEAEAGGEGFRGGEGASGGGQAMGGTGGASGASGGGQAMGGTGGASGASGGGAGQLLGGLQVRAPLLHPLPQGAEARSAIPSSPSSRSTWPPPEDDAAAPAAPTAPDAPAVLSPYEYSRRNSEAAAQMIGDVAADAAAVWKALVATAGPGDTPGPAPTSGLPPSHVPTAQRDMGGA